MRVFCKVTAKTPPGSEQESVQVTEDKSDVRMTQGVGAEQRLEIFLHSKQIPMIIPNTKHNDDNNNNNIM